MSLRNSSVKPYRHENMERKLEIKCPEFFGIANTSSSDDKLYAMLEEATEDIATDRFRKYTESRNKSTGGDDTLLSSLIRKNEQLLKEVLSKNEVIKQQEIRLKLLESKLQATKFRTGDFQSNHSEVEILEGCCERLQKQVLEMEEFLHDYGLVWVGTQTTSPTQMFKRQGPFGWKPGSSDTDQVMLDQIVSSIQSLNNWIGIGEAKVTRDSTDCKMAYFKEQEPIPITLYADGISLREGPFRPFTQHATMQFVQDILDGFFPSELEPFYPNGVPFKLTDKRTERFLEKQLKLPKLSNQSFKLGAGTSTSSAVDVLTSEKDRTQIIVEPASTTQKTSQRNERKYFTDFDQGIPNKLSEQMNDEKNLLDQLELYPCPRQDPLTFEDLLNRLPECTVGRSGRIINIRSDLRAQFAPTKEPAPVKQVNLDYSQSIKDHCVSSSTHSRSGLVALRIRSEDGSHIYNLRMAASDTIGQLYACLNLAREDKSPYRLVMMTPYKRCINEEQHRQDKQEDFTIYRRALTQLDMTLEQAGLQTRTMLRMERSSEASFSQCPVTSATRTTWNPMESFVTNVEKTPHST